MNQLLKHLSTPLEISRIAKFESVRMKTNKDIALQSRKILQTFVWGGGRGAGDQEKRGWEVYGRHEKRGQEVGFLRWRESEEKGKIMQHCAIFHNRKMLRGGSQKIQGGNRD